MRFQEIFVLGIGSKLLLNVNINMVNVIAYKVSVGKIHEYFITEN